MNHWLLDRRSFGAVAAWSLTGLAAPGARAQTRPDKPRVVIGVADKSLFQFLPLTIAERLGYFAAEGVEVEILEFAAGTRIAQAVQEAAVHVVAGTFEETITSQAGKPALKAFVLLGRAPQVAFGVSRRTLPGYKSMADLRGRRIGVSVPGSTAQLVASLLLARAGVAPSEVTFVELASVPGAVAAMRAGQVDAMSHTEPVMSMLEHKLEVRLVSDTRTLKGTQELFGGPMPAACLYAGDEFLQKNPNLAQALANAVVHALKWLQTAGPSDLIKAVPEAYLLGDRSLYLAAFNKIRETIAVDGLITDEGARTALRALGRVERNFKADKVDLARTYTNDFARKAKEKFLA